MPYKTLTGLALVVAAQLVAADVLLIDGVEMSAQTDTSRPARGSTMARVEANFGQPTSRQPTVGEPPITRWDYPAFSVYFEYDHVIHAVAHR